jgi:hypothetical protein
MANPTCRQVITEALEESGARGFGDAPSPEELARGLIRLQHLWNAGVETGLFGRVEEYYATAAYEAEEGQRVYAAGFAITLPTQIEDCDSETNYRRPRDFAMVQVVDAGEDPEISLYDANEAAWTRIDNLTIDGECPFGRRYRHSLAAALALCMSPLFLRSANDITSAYAAQLRSALSLRQSAPRREADVEYM